MHCEEEESEPCPVGACRCLWAYPIIFKMLNILAHLFVQCLDKTRHIITKFKVWLFKINKYDCHVSHFMVMYSYSYGNILAPTLNMK